MPKEEILDAEVVQDICTPDYSQTEVDAGPAKQPRTTRKADYPKFTPETREHLLELVSQGVPDNHACNAVGIQVSTLYRWLEKGRLVQNKLDEGLEDELYPVELDFANFYVSYYRVKASPVTDLISTVMTAALGSPGDPENGILPTKPNPGLALKMLEKLDPEQFGQRSKVDMNVKGKIGHLHADLGQLNTGEDVVKQLTTEEIKILKADIKQRRQLVAKTT